MLEFTAPGTVLKIHTHSREILLNQIPFDALTGTENAILVTLAEHASGWCSTDYLVQKLYDINDEPVTNIVQVFISKIRKKLNGISPGASEILQTRCRMGYRLCSVE